MVGCVVFAPTSKIPAGMAASRVGISHSIFFVKAIMIRMVLRFTRVFNAVYMAVAPLGEFKYRGSLDFQRS